MFCYKKNIEKYRIEKSIFSYIVSAEKNRFLAKSDRDRLGLQIPRSAVIGATFMETLQWDNFCNFGATLLGFGTLFTNIILLWIRNFEKNRTTPTTQKCPKTPQNTLNMNLTIIFSFFSLGLELPNHFR